MSLDAFEFLQKLYLVAIFALTFLLTITWQFAQFVLFLQALIIFGLSLIGILDKDKVRRSRFNSHWNCPSEVPILFVQFPIRHAT